MSIKFTKPRSFRIASAIFISLLSVLLPGCARQDSFDWGRVVLFSAVAGKVLDSGKPAAGLTLTRTVKWKGDEYIDTTTTDKDGNFSFSALKKFTVLWQILPAEAVIDQKIRASYKGEDRLFWGTFKENYEDNGELIYQGNKRREGVSGIAKIPILISCDLAAALSPATKGVIGHYCLLH